MEIHFNEVEIKELKNDIEDKYTLSKIPSENPVVVIFGGPNGVGKSTIMGNIPDNYVVIDSDEIITHIPNIEKIFDEHGKETPKVIDPLNKELTNHLVEHSLSNGYNIAFQDTLGNPERTLKLIEEASKNGYKIEVNVVCADRSESELGITKRYFKDKLNVEQMKRNSISLENTGIFARDVSKEVHDRNFTNMQNTIKMLQDKNIPVKFFERSGEEIVGKSYDEIRKQKLPLEKYNTVIKESIDCINKAKQVNDNDYVNRIKENMVTAFKNLNKNEIIKQANELKGDLKKLGYELNNGKLLETKTNREIDINSPKQDIAKDYGAALISKQISNNVNLSKELQKPSLSNDQIENLITQNENLRVEIDQFYKSNEQIKSGPINEENNKSDNSLKNISESLNEQAKSNVSPTTINKSHNKDDQVI